MNTKSVNAEQWLAWGRRETRRCGTLLLCLLPLTSSLLPLTAQQVPSATDFLRLRDSMGSISDTVALRTLLRSSRRHHKARPEDVGAILRSGLLALRLGELRADPDFGTALSVFRDATRRAPHRPDPWYGRGLAEEGRSRWELSTGLNLGNRVGLKALERASAHYQRALAAHPSYAPAALALARLTLSLRDTAMVRRAAPAVRTAATANPETPELMLAWGRMERAAGKPGAAIEAFERFMAAKSNRALGLLELARTRLALGAGGEETYYEGASIADSKVAAEYLADIAPLLADSSRLGLDTLGLGLERALRRFWNDRDRVELRAEGERLREHYRRLQHARIHFPLTISRRFYGRLDAFRSGSAELDDRGIIYIRHGEPSTRLRPFIFGAMPNETWRYGRADGDLLLHFSAGWDNNGGGDLYDYRLVQSVLDLRGAGDMPQDQLLLSRQSLSSTYGRMLTWGRHGAAKARARERGIGAASIAVGTTTDSYEHQFEHRLPVVADLIAVGRNGAGSLAHLVFGIAASSAAPQIVRGEARYSLRVRLVALDRNDRPVAGMDTILAIRYSRALRRGAFVVGRAELVLPPGEWRYRAILSQGDTLGIVLPRDSVVVANTEGRSLELSDIAFGTRGRAVPWLTAAADTVLMAPSALFRKGADVELYYEVTGATARLTYRHDITVLRAERPGSRRRRPLVSLSFTEEAADAVIRSHRTVKLERLKEGNYVVELKITAPDGSSRVRQRSLTLIKG